MAELFNSWQFYIATYIGGILIWWTFVGILHALGYKPLPYGFPGDDDLPIALSVGLIWPLMLIVGVVVGIAVSPYYITKNLRERFTHGRT